MKNYTYNYQFLTKLTVSIIIPDRITTKINIEE